MQQYFDNLQPITEKNITKRIISNLINLTSRFLWGLSHKQRGFTEIDEYKGIHYKYFLLPLIQMNYSYLSRWIKQILMKIIKKRLIKETLLELIILLKL